MATITEKTGDIDNEDKIHFRLEESRSLLLLDSSVTDSNIRSIQCLQFSTFRYIIFLILNIPFLFLLYPFYKSFLFARLLIFRHCNLSSVTHILTKTKDSDWEISKVHYETIRGSEVKQFLWWEFRKLRYAVNINTGVVKEITFDRKSSFKELGKYFEEDYVLTESKYEKYKKIYGENVCYVPYTFAWNMIQKELLNPFNIYEILSAIFWIYQRYIIYAVVIIFLNFISIVSIFYGTIKEIRYLRKSYKVTSSIQIKFTTPNVYIYVNSKSIVPGMRCKITYPQKIDFDCILMSGKCYIQNTPLPKLITPLPFAEEPNTEYNISWHNEHTIYSGSVIEEIGEDGCELLVINIGFSTLNGRLIRNMLYPGNDKYVKYRDALWFALVLVSICFFGFLVCLPTFISEGSTIGNYIENLLDLITTGVPPIVPTAMFIGTSMALHRLRESDIYCVSPAKIAIAGKASIICIDAKGTLIEEEQKFIGYKLVKEKAFGNFKDNFDKVKECLSFNKRVDKRNFGYALAICHKLILYHDKIVGSREDKETFASTKAKLNDVKDNLLEVKIPGRELSIEQLRKKETSDRSIMTVITKHKETGEYWVYAKAEIQVLEKICDKESMPEDWKEVIIKYQKDCNKVLGICAKRITYNDVYKDWSELHINMTLLGIIILNIIIKDNAKKTIKAIKKANIPCIMLTSESTKVASVIAKATGLIHPQESILLSEFSGKAHTSLRWIRIDSNTSTNNIDDFKEVLDEVAFYFDQGESGTNIQLIADNKLTVEDPISSAIICNGEAANMVISRNGWDLMRKVRVIVGLNDHGMATKLVAGLSNYGESVLMVGSDSSELGALSKSDVGVLVSSSKQMSVVSALTCSRNDVIGVTSIISEGRASIVTSYECFKWMALYSIIQLTGTVILYYHSLYMTDPQYLYVDLFLVIPLNYTMALSRSKKKLHKTQPSSSLLSFPVLLSVLGQMLIQAIAQIIIFEVLRDEPEACLSENYYSEKMRCIEVTGIFLFSNIQYIGTVLTYTRGDDFREAMWKNIWFILNVVVVLLVSYFLMFLGTDNFFSDWLDLSNVSDNGRLKIFLGTILNLAVTYAFELGTKKLSKLC